MSRRRRLLLGFAALTLCGLLLIAAGWFPQEALRRVAEAKLRALTGPGSRIGALHVVPFRLEADATGVVIDLPGTRLEAARVHAVAVPSSLFPAGRTYRA